MEAVHEVAWWFEERFTWECSGSNKDCVFSKCCTTVLEESLIEEEEPTECKSLYVGTPIWVTCAQRPWNQASWDVKTAFQNSGS